MIERILELADGFLHAGVALLGFFCEFRELGALGLGECVDLLEEILKTALELVLFHSLIPF